MQVTGRKTLFIGIIALCGISFVYYVSEKTPATRVHRETANSAKASKILDDLTSSNHMSELDNHLSGTDKLDYNDFLFKLVDWPIIRKRYLPNFFIHGQQERRDADYKSGDIVFLHHNKAGGSTIKDFLFKICEEMAIPTVVVSHAHGPSVAKRFRATGTLSERTMIIGDYAFGICDHLQERPCSYFTLTRDPMRRLVSSYFYCQQGPDQLCGPVNARTVSLQQWAIHQGSFMFGQILMHPDVCASNFTKYVLRYKNRMSSTLKFVDDMDRCWFREKAYLDEVLSPKEREHILAFCVHNLENWFAVIGILEDFNSSLTMFETAYGLPFTQLAGKASNKGSRVPSKDPFAIRNMIEVLNKDDDVQMALYEDKVLYRAMKAIFVRQKEVLRLT